MKVVLLVGARNNCGDYLIVDRAKRLFSHFLPGAKLVEIDRTHAIGDYGFTKMQGADLIVLVGGPLIRNDSAEALNLASMAADGRLDALQAPFVIMGGGAKPPEPFVPTRLKFTEPTKRLFAKLETSPYFSGTRDLETLVLLRNAGLQNFRFTGCPALYSLPEIEARPFPFELRKVHRIVFSCGAPGMMSSGAIEQHIDIVSALREVLPSAEIIVAAHHSTRAEAFQAAYGKPMPSGWTSLLNRFEADGFRVVDISGGLAGMEELYRSADLHVGYRVHAHVLMTSWRKQSVLIAEDGRASGMADVIEGAVWRAWCKKRSEMTLIDHLLRRTRTFRAYDGGLGNRIAERLVRASEHARPLNQLKIPCAFDAMERWFRQFTPKARWRS